METWLLTVVYQRKLTTEVPPGDGHPRPDTIHPDTTVTVDTSFQAWDLSHAQAVTSAVMRTTEAALKPDGPATDLYLRKARR
jgi:hypothetical protein